MGRKYFLDSLILKILDSSIIIAILGDINCPHIIDNLIKLKHDLIVPHFVYCEVMAGSSKKSFQGLINNDKITILQLNTESEIKNLQVTYPYLGFGELDSILTYEKLFKSKSSVHCILDDKSARRIAKRRGISHKGTIGILCLMKERHIISIDEYDGIISDLKLSGFRLPKEFVK